MIKSHYITYSLERIEAVEYKETEENIVLYITFFSGRTVEKLIDLKHRRFAGDYYSFLTNQIKKSAELELSEWVIKDEFKHLETNFKKENNE